MINTSKIPRGNEQFWLFVISVFSFCTFLGWNTLFDWDEINFAESAREMIVTGDFYRVQINYEPFWEKPPLFFWLQTFCMSIFGDNEFAARLPNAVIGGFTLVSLYRIGTILKDVTFGRILYLLYLASILPYFYFKTAIIDPTFNFFIFLGLVNIIRYEQIETENRRLLPWEESQLTWGALKAGFWIGLATLTKGPVALLMVIIIYPIFLILYKKFVIRWLQIFLFASAYLLVIGIWFGWETYVHGSWFLEKFIEYQIELFSQPVAGHEQPFFYHFVVFFIGCFPMSIFVIPGMGNLPERYSDRLVRKYMTIWFWTILILFSIVKTKIVHYSSMAYFPGVYLAATFLYYQIKEDQKFPWHTYVLYSLGMIVFGFGVTLILFFAPDIQQFKSFIKDVNVLDAMNTPLAWTGWEYFIGVFYILIMIVGLLFLVFRKTFYFLIIFSVSTPIFLNFINYIVVPKVAVFTQTSAVNFWKNQQEKDVYLVPYGYKSYAHLFYGKIRPENSLKQPVEWVFTEKCSKKAVFAVKLNKNEEFVQNFGMKVVKLYQQGGFVFYRKK